MNIRVKQTTTSSRVKSLGIQKMGATVAGSAVLILTSIITLPAHASMNCADYLPNSYFERIENTPVFAGKLVKKSEYSQQLQNAAGKVVLEHLSDAYILMDRYVLAKQYGRYGVANAAGEIIIPFEYDDIQTEPDIATSFIVSLNSSDGDGVHKQGIINRNGAWIYPLADADIQHAHYDSAHDQDYFIITEHRHNKGLENKGLTGLLTDKGDWAVLPQYDTIQPLNACTGKPLYLQVSRQHKTALIDQNNAVIIPFAANQHIELFNDHSAVPLFLRSSLIEGSTAKGMSQDIVDDIVSAQIIDANGKLRLASDAPIVKLLYHQLYAYQQAGKYGFIDDKIRVVLAPQFKSYRDEADKVWVEKRGKMRRLDRFITLD